jgi:aminobenzoyl-glutamate transport protein
MNGSDAQPSGVLPRFLGLVEKAGNALPHPGSLFAIGALLVILLSGVMAGMDVEVTHPGTGAPIRPVSLMTVEGFHRIVTSMVTNFTGFAPLGTVLVAMLGIGIAERSGFIGALLRLLVLSSPRRWLTFVVVFAGVLSNAASEIGYVLLVPMGAIIFLSVGRHPIAGLAAAFAGVSGGYSANLVLGTIDPLLAGLSEEAARIVDPTYEVNPACNYYFMAVSTFFIAAAGTWVTERIVIPRLGVYRGEEGPEALNPLTAAEKRGLGWALVVTVIFTALLLAGTLPAGGFLRDLETGSVLRSPLLTGIVAFVFLGASATGIAYGMGAGTIRSDTDIMNGMGKAIETLGVYMVLVFFAAQFVAYFNWTNLGLIVAVKGAQVLGASGLGDIPLMMAVVGMAAMINLVMGSASAKWAILAPIFVPMFMLLGYTPEMVQAAYRVGDSVTNIISPMMSYFALIVAFVGRYERNAGIGTVVATMLPYTIAFSVVWVSLLSFWILLGLPLGPGAEIRWVAAPW